MLLPFALGLTWVSSMYFNAVLQLFVPGAVFPYGDRVFTTYLFYLYHCLVLNAIQLSSLSLRASPQTGAAIRFL